MLPVIGKGNEMPRIAVSAPSQEAFQQQRGIPAPGGYPLNGKMGWITLKPSQL